MKVNVGTLDRALRIIQSGCRPDTSHHRPSARNPRCSIVHSGRKAGATWLHAPSAITLLAATAPAAM